jgi:superkiller protein 3
MVVAALTISLIEQTQLDYKRLHLLIDFINQGEHEVWQRALAGLVIALDGRERKIDKLFKQQLADLKSMPKVQEALVYMHLAFYEFKKKTVGKSPVDHLVKTIKEEDQRQLKTNPKDAAKKEEEEVPKPLQGISVRELIENFAVMKNYEFFAKPQQWFLPFHEQNNLALQSLQATRHDINAEQLLHLLSRVVSWDNANKYALCFHIDDLPTKVIDFFNDFIDWLEEVDEQIEKGEIQVRRSVGLSHKFVFEQYFMDLYRFFEHYPEKKRAIHLWQRKQLYKKNLLNLIAADIAQLKVNAHHHWTHKEYKQALPYYEQLTELEPQNDQHWANLGEVFLVLNKAEEAIVAYQKALAIDDKKAAWWAALGKAYLKKPGFVKLETALVTAATLDNSKKNVRSILSYLGKKLQEHPPLLKVFRAVLECKPNIYEAWARLGKEYHKLEKYQKASEAYEKALKINPKQADTWYNLGVAYQDQDKHLEAIGAYEKALKIEPNYEIAWYNLGVAHQHQEKYLEAIDAYKTALKINPKYEIAWNNLGNIYDNQGKYSEAIEAYEKALKINPQQTDTWYNLGVAYQDQDKHSEAIEAYEKALKIKPNKADAWNNLGFTYLATGELKKAQTHFNKALEYSNNKHSVAHMNLGFVVLLESDEDQALALCQKSLGVYDAKEEGIDFFEKMEKAFPYLEKQGITREAFDALKAKLREYEVGQKL